MSHRKYFLLCYTTIAIYVGKLFLTNTCAKSGMGIWKSLNSISVSTQHHNFQLTDKFYTNFYSDSGCAFVGENMSYDVVIKATTFHFWSHLTMYQLSLNNVDSNVVQTSNVAWKFISVIKSPSHFTSVFHAPKNFKMLENSLHEIILHMNMFRLTMPGKLFIPPNLLTKSLIWKFSIVCKLSRFQIQFKWKSTFINLKKIHELNRRFTRNISSAFVSLPE